LYAACLSLEKLEMEEKLFKNWYLSYGQTLVDLQLTKAILFPLKSVSHTILTSLKFIIESVKYNLNFSFENNKINIKIRSFNLNKY